jgi:Cytochrome c7 and related cytochrome c
MISVRSVNLMLPIVAAAVLLVAAQGHAQNASTSQFDHNPTGFALTGTHVFVPCASCHINARFKNTPTACFGCHNGMTAPGAASVLSHPVTTNYCEGCHQTTTWRDYRFIDHVQALGPCANCHNNKIATGKTPKHIITEAACNTCHFNTVTFKGGIVPTDPPKAPAAATTPAPAGTTTTTPAGTAKTSTPAATATTTAPPNTSLSNPAGVRTSSGMPNASTKPSHVGLISGCAACHNGVAATGKRSNHIVTSAPCETCHKSTVTFAGARMNHTGLVANCVRCHSGAIATGRPAKHIVTNAPCETCHKSTMTFAGARVDHASLTATCVSCHNGSVAEGRPPRHIVTTSPCDACHRTAFWTPATYRHVSPAYVNHGPGISCGSCHVANSQAAAWKFPAFKPNCAGCHVDKYRPMPHVKFQRPVKVYYTVAELRDCTGSCHTYADNTQRTIVARNFSRHRPLGGGW